jgi:hypothetical protein
MFLRRGAEEEEEEETMYRIVIMTGKYTGNTFLHTLSAETFI